MPIPVRNLGENKDEYIGRCISELSGEYDQDQAAAICYAQLSSQKFKTLSVSPFGTSKQEFYDWDTCIADMKSEGYSEDAAAKICGSIKAGR